MKTLTTDQLREEIQASLGRLMRLPRLLFNISDRQLAYGFEAYWQQVSDAELTRLSALLPTLQESQDREKSSGAPDQQACACGHSWGVHRFDNDTKLTPCLLCPCRQFGPPECP